MNCNLSVDTPTGNSALVQFMDEFINWFAQFVHQFISGVDGPLEGKWLTLKLVTGEAGTYISCCSCMAFHTVCLEAEFHSHDSDSVFEPRTDPQWMLRMGCNTSNGQHCLFPLLWPCISASKPWSVFARPLH